MKSTWFAILLLAVTLTINIQDANAQNRLGKYVRPSPSRQQTYYIELKANGVFFWGSAGSDMSRYGQYVVEGNRIRFLYQGTASGGFDQSVFQGGKIRTDGHAQPHPPSQNHHWPSVVASAARSWHADPPALRLLHWTTAVAAVTKAPNWHADAIEKQWCAGALCGGLGPQIRAGNQGSSWV